MLALVLDTFCRLKEQLLVLFHVCAATVMYPVSECLRLCSSI